MFAENLMYSTLGELIQKYRIQANLKLSKLATLSGVSKGVISKLENGETRRPELKTIFPLAECLKIPIVTIIEYYIEIDERPEVLRELLTKAINMGNLELSSRVASKFLQSTHEESHALVERLYSIASSSTEKTIKLTLYNIIIKYARERGIQQFLAKGLLQKYLIERDDFKLLEETFYSGKEILHYVDFLFTEEKVTLYYKMALHAYALKKYENCIEWGSLGHAIDLSNHEIKERIALAICNSYLSLGDFTVLEEHLLKYEKKNFYFIIERMNYYKAVILSRKGKYEEAIPLLKSCLEDVTDSNRVYRVNELLEALFQIEDMNSIKMIIETEEKKFLLLDNDPNQYSGLSKYYRFKAMFLTKTGLINKGMEAEQQSIQYLSFPHKLIQQLKRENFI